MKKGGNSSNTLIITDSALVHPESHDLLQETISAIKEFVNELNTEKLIHSCLQILHLKSFRRVLLIFTESKIAKLVFEYFQRLGIQIGFARNDNRLTTCDLNSDCTVDSNVSESSLNPQHIHISDPINERYIPGDTGVAGRENNLTFLRVPHPPIQMQSPPASPYEGWIPQPEEPPSDTTLSFHPKTLGHVLHTYDGEEVPQGLGQMRKVFSSFIDDEMPMSRINESLEDLNLGESLEDTNERGGNGDDRDLLKGSLLQKNKFVENNEFKIPILVINQKEAENLRQVATNFDLDKA